jgi:hypothetical protein
MTKEQVMGLVRHTLTFVGGFLVMQGIVAETVVTEVSGALLTLIGTLWSVFSKK